MGALPGASERLTLFETDLLKENSYDAAIAKCSGVFHVASPLPAGKGSDDPENVVLKPAIEGTLNVLRSCKKAGSVQTVVLTSSMSAMAPVPEPALKTEEHWSDPDEQMKRGSFYGASKTRAELAAYKFVQDENCSFRLVSICPTMVVGPCLHKTPSMTMMALCNWFKNGRAGGRCPNDSMSFVDVRDCAAQHVAAMDREEFKGRYMSLESSWHWNELELLLQQLHPAMSKSLPCEGIPVTPTQFDKTRQASLGVNVRPVPEILKAAYEELQARSLL